MKTLLGLAMLAVVIAPVWAADAYPLDQDAIHDEIARLQDNTGEIDKKQWTRARKLLDKGIAAHDRRDYDRAIELYTDAIAVAPTWATAYYERGLSEMSLGRSIEALEDILRCLSLDPKHAQAMVTRGSLEDDLGYEDRALATYSALLELDPDHYLGLVNMAITYMNRRDFDQADPLLIRATEAKPEQPAAYIHLANNARLRDFNYDEARYLEQYLEVGRNDPRYANAKARYEELNTHDLQIDPTAPYAEIELAVALSRSLWKTQTHRERNPEARGYRLTLAEEKDVVQGLLLELWRKEKADDPAAQHGYYDLVLSIDDAGFFDEYVYTQKRAEIGSDAGAWIEAHPDRVEAFFAWAREAGYAPDDEGTEEAPAAEEDPDDAEVVELTPSDLPGLVMEVAEDSDWIYEIDMTDSEVRPDEAEIRRWRKFRYEGDDVADCKIDIRKAMSENVGTVLHVFQRAARCLTPSDPQWADLQAVQRLGRRFDDVPFALTASIEVADEQQVKLAVFNEHALFYGLAKATWPREPFLRRVFDAEAIVTADPIEEWAALLTAIGAYRNRLEPDDETDEAGEADAYMERLEAVNEAGYLDAFVAYEILHKLYGVSLERLPSDLAEELDDYLARFVFPSADGGG